MRKITSVFLAPFLLIAVLFMSVSVLADNVENEQRIKSEERLANQQGIKERYQEVLDQREQLDKLDKEERQEFKEELKEQRDETREDKAKQGSGRANMTREEKEQMRENWNNKEK